VTAVVLVEGASDRAALEALARRRGRDLDAEGVSIRPIGGAQAIGRVLTRYAHSDVRLAGLCDAGEERDFRRALERAGLGSELTRRDMERLGFYVCDADLEDELIRALGADVVEEAVAELGELPRLRTFQRQPEWRGRPPAVQLHRFAGAGSGRKERLATALAKRLTPATTPAPLARLVRYVGVSVTIDDCPKDPAAR
jgi:hypothetical protein